MARPRGCVICEADLASGLFCPRHGSAYDRAREQFDGDEQSTMRWVADQVRKHERWGKL